MLSPPASLTQHRTRQGRKTVKEEEISMIRKVHCQSSFLLMHASILRGSTC
jgi:hypothetical protein